MDNNSALMIVDVQVAHFAREKFDGKKVFNGDQLLKNIKSLIMKARKNDVPIIFVQYTENDESFMGKGKAMWDIHPQLKPNEEDIRILKYHVDPFYNTNLHEKLQTLGVKKINNSRITN